MPFNLRQNKQEERAPLSKLYGICALCRLVDRRALICEMPACTTSCRLRAGAILDLSCLLLSTRKIAHTYAKRWSWSVARPVFIIGPLNVVHQTIRAVLVKTKPSNVLR